MDEYVKKVIVWLILLIPAALFPNTTDILPSSENHLSALSI